MNNTKEHKSATLNKDGTKKLDPLEHACDWSKKKQAEAAIKDKNAKKK